MRVAMGQSRLLGNLVSTLLRPWIVSSHHFTTAVTKGDGPVRVFGHHGSKQPTSNGEPTLRDGAFEKQSCCLRGVWGRRSSQVDTRNV